jgi:hypothetical protein
MCLADEKATVTAMPIGERRRRVRERFGWTILFVVVSLSRLAVWVDGVVGSARDGNTEERQ